MNPFVHSTAARRYAQARPHYHPVAITLIRDFLPVDWPVQRALDVACGTGQSCVALKGLAQEIVGTDSSPEMLAEATVHPSIRYVEATAEDLPFPDQYFDLITVSSAFHWFDRDKFLAEANRVLAVGHWLVIYDNSFKGIMKGNPDFAKWMQASYMERYPCPSRHWSPLTEGEAEACGFRFARNESYSNDIMFDVKGLARYLTTQSNIIAAVEEAGRESLDEVCEWLESSLRAMFGPQQGTFAFGGTIWYLEKSRTTESNATSG